MLTPQEVQEQKFEKAVFGGYDMASVDDFLERVTEDYTALYKDNAVLKSKLKVLVDTVEEYRSVDEAMRRTLFSAQKMADDLMRDATEKSESIMAKANNDAGEMARRVREEHKMELQRQKVLKEATVRFIQQLTEMYARQLEFITNVPNNIFTESFGTAGEDVHQTAQEISDSVNAQLAAESGSNTVVMPPHQKQASFTPPPPSPSIPAVRVPPPQISEPEPEGAKTTGRLPFFDMAFKSQREEQSETKEEDTAAPRPRFEFPNLQIQFGQQYSGHGENKN